MEYGCKYRDGHISLGLTVQAKSRSYHYWASGNDCHLSPDQNALLSGELAADTLNNHQAAIDGEVFKTQGYLMYSIFIYRYYIKQQLVDLFP